MNIAATPSAPAPALQLASQLKWLTGPGGTGTYVAALKPVAPDTLHVVVRDPEMGSGASREEAREANRWIADNAASVLEQAVKGVRLVAVNEDGYVGKSGYFSSDEQYFASNIPGVTSQAGEVWNDRNRNDVEEPGEVVWLFPVDSKRSANRIDAIVRDTINDLPVEFEVEPRR